MRIYNLWLRLPPGIRRAIGLTLRTLRLPVGRLHAAIGAPQADGFRSETPETPPAIEACLGDVRRAGLAGDYYEFGLFRGYTFWYARQAAARLGLADMRSWGFDSFAGLPPPRGGDAETGEFRTGDYACPRAAVEAALDRHGFDWSRAALIEGFYDRSLRPGLKAELGMGPVALALIDCDLYESTVPVLEFLADRLQDGSILMFDDYNCFGASDGHGERRAFREFLAAHPEWEARPLRSFGWHGEAFTLTRRAAPPGSGVLGFGQLGPGLGVAVDQGPDQVGGLGGPGPEGVVFVPGQGVGEDQVGDRGLARIPARLVPVDGEGDADGPVDRGHVQPGPAEIGLDGPRAVGVRQCLDEGHGRDSVG